MTVKKVRRVAGLRDAVFKRDAHPADKGLVAEDLADMRSIFGRSLASKQNLCAGTLITEEILVAKKPATGIPVGDAYAVIGRTLARDVTSDRLIAWDDLRVDG